MSGVNFYYSDGIGTVELDNPETKNSLNDELVQTITAKLKEWASESDIKGLILSGANKSFSSGGDLKMIGAQKEKANQPGGREEIAATMRRNMQLIEVLKDFPAPTVALIDGVCVGAAIGWVSACDLRFATENAKFLTGFIKVGLSTDFGTSKMLSEIVGRSTAANWLLTSPMVNADQAEAVGLLDRILPAEELDAAAKDFINGVSAKAVVSIRKNLDDVNLPLSDALDNEAKRFASNL